MDQQLLDESVRCDNWLVRSHERNSRKIDMYSMLLSNVRSYVPSFRKPSSYLPVLERIVFEPGDTLCVCDLSESSDIADQFQNLVNTGVVLAKTPRETVVNADVSFSPLLDNKACLETAQGEYLLNCNSSTRSSFASSEEKTGIWWKFEKAWCMPICQRSARIPQLREARGSHYIAGHVSIIEGKMFIGRAYFPFLSGLGSSGCGCWEENARLFGRQSWSDRTCSVRGRSLSRWLHSGCQWNVFSSECDQVDGKYGYHREYFSVRIQDYSILKIVSAIEITPGPTAKELVWKKCCKMSIPCWIRAIMSVFLYRSAV